MSRTRQDTQQGNRQAQGVVSILWSNIQFTYQGALQYHCSSRKSPHSAYTASSSAVSKEQSVFETTTHSKQQHTETHTTPAQAMSGLTMYPPATGVGPPCWIVTTVTGRCCCWCTTPGCDRCHQALFNHSPVAAAAAAATPADGSRGSTCPAGDLRWLWRRRPPPQQLQQRPPQQSPPQQSSPPGIASTQNRMLHTLLPTTKQAVTECTSSAATAHHAATRIMCRPSAAGSPAASAAAAAAVRMAETTSHQMQLKAARMID